MTKDSEGVPVRRLPNHGGSLNRLVGATTLLTVGIVIAASIFLWVNSSSHSTFQTLPPSGNSKYPTGVVDAAEPSGEAPPGPNSLAGYQLTYVSDFKTTSLTASWNVFTGVPAGDYGGQFASSHVVVADGMLHLNAWKDPKYHDRWVTGGLCQCGLTKTYGAYFIRSRITGAGPNEVELLWPSTNIWPPEIDFNETGGQVSSTSSTLHFGAINQIDQRFISIDMQEWHTWGVIWTPQSITYVVDGEVWGTITATSEITQTPMTLDLEQLAICNPARECPTRPVSMLIDWVAEYSAN